MTSVSAGESRKVAEAARQKDWALPSFGKELFLGHFRPKLIFPQPRLDPEMVRKGEAFLNRMRTFLETKVDPGQIERDARIPTEVIDGFKELGALGMKVPEEYGGLGLSQVYYNQVLALVGSWHPSLSALLSAHQSIGVGEPILLFGTEEQKRQWLPLVARTHISAFLLTEPDVGSDPARLTTVAIPTEDGSGYRITGEKLWASNGNIADVAVVLAKVPKGEGHRGGISAFIVPYHDEGVIVEHRNTFMGLRGMDNSLTRFQDVFVPKTHLIGAEGHGLRIAFSTLNTGRLSLPGIQAGTAKWATKIAREFASQRVQWGKPVGQHDEVAQKIAFIAASAFGLEAMVDVASRLADEKRNDVRIEAALAKLYASELCWQVVDELVQVCGGRGYETAESLRGRGERPFTVEQVMRDTRVYRIFEGTSQMMHLSTAREAVDQHLRVAGKLIAPDAGFGEKAKALAPAVWFYVRWLPRLAVGSGQRPGAFSGFGKLAPHLRFAERSSRKLARSTFYGMARWKGGLENKQAYLARIVDIGAELFALSSAVVYARTLSRETPERARQVEDVADLFCRQARGRVERLFHELRSNNDEANHALALRILEGKDLWLEEGILDPSSEGSSSGHPSNSHASHQDGVVVPGAAAVGEPPGPVASPPPTSRPADSAVAVPPPGEGDHQ
jgi:alkylation response protein AidB-like acyl-CoA dehydrogenase